MEIVFVTRRERFSGAHRMYRPDWENEQNIEVFGKCSNPNWHGHNYTLHVTVKGNVDKETGYVVDLSKLSMIIKTFIIDKLDHKNLNLEVDFMKNTIVSSENIAIRIWQQLYIPIKQLGAELHCIRIEETENNFVEYFG